MFSALRDEGGDDPPVARSSDASSSVAHSPASPRRGTRFACGLVYDDAMLEHAVCGLERPDRLTAIMRYLEGAKLPAECERVAARPCTRSEALLVHSERHWEQLLDLPNAPLTAANMDSNEHTANSARLAAGGLLALVERVCAGSLRAGFALVRPPGHHAGHSSMQGFCFLNNLAMAARFAQRQLGMRRVLIVDWDVHHGNGTEALLADDPGIMYVSLHRFTKGFYPRTGDATSIGVDAGRGFSLNIPWRRTGMGNEEYRAAFEQIVMPVAKQFEPQLVLVSAGFDASRGDPLGEMSLTPAAYAHMTHELQKLAGGRLVCALEGGYRLHTTAIGVAAVLRALIEPDTPVTLPEAHHADEHAAHAALQVARACQHTLNAVCRVHRQYWGVLHQHEVPRRVRDAAGADSVDAESGTTSASHEHAAEAGAERATRAGQPAAAAASSGTATRSGESQAAIPAAGNGAHGGARPAGTVESAQRDDVTAGARETAPPVPTASTAADTCRSCGELQPKQYFSKSQWRRLGAGRRTCTQCTANGGGTACGPGPTTPAATSDAISAS